MRKLLIVSSGSVHVYNFISLIKDHFDEIFLITDSINADYKGQKIVVDFSISNLKSLFITPTRIRKTIETFRPSIIHVHQANSIAWHVFKAAKGFQIPTVLTAWGSDVLLTPKRGLFFKWMVKKNLLKADALTSDSAYMAKEIQDLTDHKCAEILIANFGIDELPQTGSKKQKIIYSNRLHEPLYRIDRIIKAFSAFISKPQNPDWKLVLAGTGSQTEKLKKLTVELGISNAVSFEGWVDRNRNTELYDRASLFVSIPASDATSVSLLEAMSSGCLPVVSNLPANREWIVHGENGYIVEDVDADFLSEAVHLDFEKAAGLNKKSISERATKAVSAKRFIDLYNKLLRS